MKAHSYKEYSSHQKWLKEVLRVLEEEYKIHNLDIFSSNGQSLEEQLATLIISNFIFSIISTDSSSKGVHIV